MQKESAAATELCRRVSREVEALLVEADLADGLGALPPTQRVPTQRVDRASSGAGRAEDGVAAADPVLRFREEMLRRGCGGGGGGGGGAGSPPASESDTESDTGLDEGKVLQALRQHGRSKSILPRIKTQPMRVEGWMAKQGHFIKNWKNRWFVLEERIMRYYARQGDERPKGTIYLAPGTEVDTRTGSHKANSFIVNTPMKKFSLQAADDDEMEEWIRAIRHNLVYAPAAGDDYSRGDDEDE